MAIPFNLPSDEETEDTYRRIDQLLLDLYHLLRQIILRQRAVRRESGLNDAGVAPQEGQSSRTVVQPPQEETANTDRHLPDIVVDALPVVRKSAPVLRRRRRRQEKPPRRFRQTPYDEGFRFSASQQPVANSSASWLNVGLELRQIAEEITFISRNGNSTRTKRRREIKASSLFSLLVPAPLTGTIWTTVIILVGWRLLTKQR